jgi:hypothetical protein
MMLVLCLHQAAQKRARKFEFARRDGIARCFVLSGNSMLKLASTQ